MPALNRNEKVECNICKQLIAKSQISRHRQRCNSGTFKCSKCNFHTKSQKDLDYHMAKAHAPEGKKIDTTCGTCGKHFPSYYSLQQHRKKEHGTLSKVSTSSSQNFAEEFELEETPQLQEELSACQHFFQDTEIQNGRHRVFNFKLDKLDPNEINSKLKVVYEKLTCAAKINIALGFLLRNVEDGMYRYFYPHENNTLFNNSHLISEKNDLAKLQDRISKLDLVENCARERQSTKWRFCKLTNITIFAALLKNIPVGCSDVSLPEPLLKNPYLNCLISNSHKKPYNDNLCLFRALSLHLNGSSDLETNTQSLFTKFIEKASYDAEHF